MELNKKNVEITSDEVIVLMKELIPRHSPYFQEDEIMEFVYGWYVENGIDAYIHEYHEQKLTNFKGKNVICELSGDRRGPAICLNGHLDTVNICHGWTKDPLAGIVEGDKIYGLGSLDMKSGCCAIMLAIRKFYHLHKEFRGKIIATLVSDEEGPYNLGINSVIDDGILDQVDVSIITEPSAGFNYKPFPDICLGARGGYSIEVEFVGKSAHGALPETGINAAVDAGKFMCELEKIDMVEDEFLGKGTVSVIGIRSDGGPCSIPDYSKVELYWHIVLGENEETVEKQIKEVIKKADIESDFKVSFRDAPNQAGKGFMPFTVPKENDFVILFSQSVQNICKRSASVSYFRSVGDFNYLGTRLNAPVIIFGAEGENFHGVDEYATISSIVKTAEILYDFLRKVTK